MVKIVPDKQNKLSKDSSADCFQIRSVAEERCIKKIGQVDNDIMDKIRKAIATVLNIQQPL
jgi:mRNA interferase MazF